MNKKGFVLTIFLFICSWFLNEGFGQSDSVKSQSIMLRFGVIHQRLIDEAFTHNKMKFTGTPFNLDMAYQRKSNKTILWAYAQYSGGELTSNNILKADLHHFQLATAYAFRINPSFLRNNTHTFIGFRLGLSDYYLTDRYVLENLTFTFTTKVDAYFNFTMDINEKNSFNLNLLLPVAGFLKRLEWNGGANQTVDEEYNKGVMSLLYAKSRFVFFSPFDFPELNLSYAKKLGAKTTVSLHYSFDYVFNQYIQPIRLYGNGILLGFKYDF